MAISCFLLVFVFLSVHGFLLDKTQSSSGQLGTSNQYVTSLEFLDETKVIHLESQQLRRYVDKSLAILTSQLEHKFEFLEQKLVECENQSVPSHAYESLEQNFMDLQRKYENLERKYTDIQTLNKEYTLIQTQLVSLQNKTSEISNDVIILKQLGNIKQLHEIQTLQQAVQTVSAQTHSLSVNERARSQDFLALYNMTKDSKRVLSKFNTNISNRFNSLETKTDKQLLRLEQNHNSTTADMSNKFQLVIALNTNTNNQLKNLEFKTKNQLLRIEQSQNSTAAEIITRMETKETSDNLTLTMVQKQINNNAIRVAMTSNPATSRTISNTIIKFDEVKYSVGITNLASYKTTGKFTCQHEGLYLISASAMSHTKDAQYYILLNGKHLSYTYITQNNNNEVHTAAVTVTRGLNLNDQVWLYAAGSWHIYGESVTSDIGVFTFSFQLNVAAYSFITQRQTTRPEYSTMLAIYRLGRVIVFNKFNPQHLALLFLYILEWFSLVHVCWLVYISFQ